jgi:hypothetical protein
MRKLLPLFGLLAVPASAQDYPPGNVVVASSGNVANATATATIAAQAGRLNYLNNLIVTGGGATAASVVTCTITGLQGGTISFIYGAPAGAAIRGDSLAMPFSAPIPASAPNTAIVASCPALGAGNTRMVVTITGHFK